MRPSPRNAARHAGTFRLLAAVVLTSIVACKDSSTEPHPQPRLRTAALTVTPAGIAMGMGDARQLEAQAVSDSGVLLTGEDAGLSYKSSNEAVATVSSAGTVTATGLGEATITVTSDTVARTVRVTVGTHPSGAAPERLMLDYGPFGVAVSRTGMAYVLRHYGNLATPIDLATMTAGPSVTTGSDPVDVAFSPSGTTAFITHQFDGTMGVVDVAAGAITQSVSIPGNPWRLRISRDGSRVFTTSNDGTVSVVDANTRQVLASLSLDVELNGIAPHPTNDSLIYLTSFTSGMVFEVNWRTIDGRQLRAGGAPQEIVPTAGGEEMWIANEAGYVDVRDAETGSQLARITIPGGAFGMAMSPDGHQMWVTVPNAGRVVVIDTNSRSVIRSFDTGGTPRRVAFDVSGATAIIANEAGWVDVAR
ncbi:MAG TPA: Ig-like domain-containing protein [Gemmatimonadaceae bacterium]|nr:Ig-like domain-containing protein [Gemmatimonadaceae bacterium]